MDRTDTTIRSDGGTSASDAEGTGSSSTRSDDATTTSSTTTDWPHAEADRRVDRWLAGGLVVLAAALAANSLLGPLVSDVVTYPFSESMVNQTIGLEAVTLAVVVPWSLAAAVLLWRGHVAGPVAAIPPVAYTVYMFAQYVVGPEYLEYRPVIALHLAIFVLAGAIMVVAWNRIESESLPDRSRRRERRTAVGLVLLGAFVVSQYLPAFAAMPESGAVTQAVVDDTTMYWAIFLLDLGVVAPVTFATAAGLLRGAAWARKAAYAVAGWFVLVPISVAAMSTVMLLDDDPNAAVASVALFAGVAVLFTAFAAWVYWPLVRGD